jgi:hypothetical protein
VGEPSANDTAGAGLFRMLLEVLPADGGVAVEQE